MSTNVKIDAADAKGEVVVEQETVSKDVAGVSYPTGRRWSVPAHGEQIERHAATFEAAGVSKGDLSAMADFSSEQRKQRES